MKYTIDLDINRGFVQIFGAAEYGEVAAYPVAFQVRGGAALLKSLQKLLVRVVERIGEIDDEYHDSLEAKSTFNNGFVEFVPGTIPVTAIVQMRMVTLVIGAHKFGGDAIKLEDLLEAVNTTLAKVEAEIAQEQLEGNKE